MAPVAPVRVLGMSAKADVSAMLRGRRLLIELDLGCCRVDAYDGQLAGCRPSRVHVELEVRTPGIRSSGGSPAL